MNKILQTLATIRQSLYCQSAVRDSTLQCQPNGTDTDLPEYLQVMKHFNQGPKEIEGTEESVMVSPIWVHTFDDDDDHKCETKEEPVYIDPAYIVERTPEQEDDEKMMILEDTPSTKEKPVYIDPVDIVERTPEQEDDEKMMILEDTPPTPPTKSVFAMFVPSRDAFRNEDLSDEANDRLIKMREEVRASILAARETTDFVPSYDASSDEALPDGVKERSRLLRDQARTSILAKRGPTKPVRPVREVLDTFVISQKIAIAAKKNVDSIRNKLVAEKKRKQKAKNCIKSLNKKSKSKKSKSKKSKRNKRKSIAKAKNTIKDATLVIRILKQSLEMALEESHIQTSIVNSHISYRNTTR